MSHEANHRCGSHLQECLTWPAGSDHKIRAPIGEAHSDPMTSPGCRELRGSSVSLPALMPGCGDEQFPDRRPGCRPELDGPINSHGLAARQLMTTCCHRRGTNRGAHPDAHHVSTRAQRGVIYGAGPDTEAGPGPISCVPARTRRGQGLWPRDRSHRIDLTAAESRIPMTREARAAGGDLDGCGSPEATSGPMIASGVHPRLDK
jgi:hypothetical protein